MFKLVYPAITAAGLLVQSQVAAAHSPPEVIRSNEQGASDQLFSDFAFLG